MKKCIKILIIFLILFFISGCQEEKKDFVTFKYNDNASSDIIYFVEQ